MAKKPPPAAKPAEEADIYAGINPDGMMVIREAEAVIDASICTKATAGIQMGKALAKARPHFRKGGWEKWVRVRWGWSPRTANNLVRVAEQFGAKSEIISDTKLGLTVLYELVKADVPDAAVTEVFEQAANGKRPSVARTKRIIAAKRAEAKTPASPASPRLGHCEVEPVAAAVAVVEPAVAQPIELRPPVVPAQEGRSGPEPVSRPESEPEDLFAEELAKSNELSEPPKNPVLVRGLILSLQGIARSLVSLPLSEPERRAIFRATERIVHCVRPAGS